MCATDLLGTGATSHWPPYYEQRIWAMIGRLESHLAVVPFFATLLLNRLIKLEKRWGKKKTLP